MEKTQSRKCWYCIGLMALILVIDQIVKIWVKTHMQIGEEIPLIGNWCKLYFVENEGMAFGMTFGGDTGKLILSLFRIIASIALCFYFAHLVHKNARTTLLVSLSLIIVGAFGNVIDCCFYGLIFNDSYYHIAQLFPSEGGYGTFLHGRVVDMFFFPLIDTTLPQWVPFWGGNHFVFFDAIFNVADAAITIGAILLIIDQLFCAKKDNETEKLEPENQQ